MINAIVDTGIWYAMFDSRDSQHANVNKKASVLEICQLVLPWPTVYETLRTKMVRNNAALRGFENYLKRPNVQFLSDDVYREAALNLAFSSSLIQKRPLSMVDCLIRLILDDVNVRIDCMATFNERDFEDLCHRRQIELI